MSSRNNSKGYELLLPKANGKDVDGHTVIDAYRWLIRQMQSTGGGPQIALALGFAAGEGLLASVPAVLLGNIVDGISGGLSTQVWSVFAMIAASLVAKESCTFGRKYLVEWSCTQLQKAAFMEQATHLLSVRVDALQDRRVGDLAVRLDKSVEGLVKLQKVTFMEAMPNLFTAGVALYLSCTEHWSVGLAMAVVLILGGLITRLQIHSQQGIRISLNEQKAAMGGSVAELLGNLGYIRAVGMRAAEEQRLENATDALRSTEFQHHKYMMSFHGSKDLVEGLGYMAVVGTAIHLVLIGELSTGGILTLAMLYSKASQPLQKMHAVVDQGHEAVIKIGALGAVRAIPVDSGLAGSIRPAAGAAQPLQASGLCVSLGSAIPGGPAPAAVLRSLSLVVNRGEVIGLAGGSGSGKSTLLKAALGLIPDYSGSLKVLGAEAKHADKPALASTIAYAQQTPFILTGSLRQNLTLAQPGGSIAADAGDAELLVALKQACIGPEDHHWPNGLDTHIHEGGRNLSGGQQQRLALARVFLQQQAELIVLDEATSALDYATEARVIDNLHHHAAAGKRAVLMVAHRLTTMRRTDRVLVLSDGSIVQNGTYSDLSEKDGIFKELLNAAVAL